MARFTVTYWTYITLDRDFDVEADDEDSAALVVDEMRQGADFFPELPLIDGWDIEYSDYPEDDWEVVAT